MSNPNSVFKCAVWPGVFDGVSYFARSLGYWMATAAFTGGRVARDIRGIVRERPQGKGVLVRILTLRQQLANKITASNVMHQVAEFHAAKWVVTEILNDGAAVRVAVRFFELGLC